MTTIDGVSTVVRDLSQESRIPATESTPRISPPAEAEPLRAPRVSAAWLLGWELARRGMPASVRVQRDLPAATDAPASHDIRVHLRRPIPAGQLAYAVRHLIDHRAACVVLLTDDEGPLPYGERLHVDGDSEVLRVERRFARPGEHATGDRRSRFLGVVYRGTIERSKPQATAWRTLRGILAEGMTFQVLPVRAPDIGFDLFRGAVTSLADPELMQLGSDLGWREVAPSVFAPPDLAIDAGATLRGPLLIEVPAGPNAIHVGPDWVRPGAPPVTVAVDTREEAFAAAPYFVGPSMRPRRIYGFFKRGFDIGFAIFAILITLPVTFAVALIIKSSDFGPVFFVQQREGLHGRPFGCLKFRSMVRNAEALKDKLKAANQVDGPQFKIADDPRITRIGRFLRKTNIDELPQFLNVLIGQMSVVGPRPSPFKENQVCPSWREARLSVKPGITGLWQVSRSRERGAADFQEWIYYDTQYVERRGFWLDVKIVLLTIKEILGKGQ